jgi:hypothetical protein
VECKEFGYKTFLKNKEKHVREITSVWVRRWLSGTLLSKFALIRTDTKFFPLSDFSSSKARILSETIRPAMENIAFWALAMTFEPGNGWTATDTADQTPSTS